MRPWIAHLRAACRPVVTGVALAATLVLAGCAAAPPVPDWKMNAQAAIERAVEAYLSGDARIEAREVALARAETARTGRPDLVARLELVRCAAQVASLRFDDCAGFEALRADAAAPEQAYALYLAGRSRPQDVPLLPEAQRPVAAALAGPGVDPAILRGVADPVSRLVAIGVVARAGKGSAAVADLAVETASAQGWRRPLLAWLEVQRRAREQAGDGAAAAALQRRITLLGGLAPGANTGR